MPKWTKEQSLAITEKGKNIIVSAGAGSGKTAVLSERVLTHIKEGMHISEMLILTFTNAAAAEMKERIRKKISQYPELKEELDVIDIASITTFDAYALSLVKKYNHLLNISDKVTLIEPTIIELKKREILDNIFLSFYEEKNENFLTLINDFCLKDDKEIFDSILKINSSLDNLYDKKNYLKNYIKNYYSNENLNNIINTYISFLRKKIKSLKTLIKNLSFYVDYNYIEKINVLVKPLLISETYDEIKKSAKIKLPPIPRGSEEAAKQTKKEISRLLKDIESYTVYESEEFIKETILKTKKYASVITQILLLLEEEVNKFKFQNDAYEFVDISKMAISILKDFEEVREEYKNKYKEILIDEYQDTNDLQDMFISLIENNNVYMVGDIKQSIYRFRNANPLLFKNKYDNYSKLNGGMKIDLNKNFRSRGEVAENINLIFNLLMDDEFGGADYFSSHQMVFGNTAYEKVNSENYQMEILNYVKDEEKKFSSSEIEIFTIARDIQNKIKNHYKIMDKDSSLERDVNYSDFVILIDRSSDFEKYKKIFEYLNIPLTIYRDKSVSDSTIILLLKNIYNLIISISLKKYDLSFKYSFMSIARSFLFSYNDDEILEMLSDDNFFENKLFEKCKTLANEIDTLSNKELYERIIFDFNFYEKIIEIGNVENNFVTIDSIWKIVDSVSSFGYTPKEFLNYLEEISSCKLDIKLSLNKEDSNSVKIMTIHASKGLEYHVCYFSGLSKKFNDDELKGKFLFSSKFGFVLPYLDDGPKNTIVKTLLKESYIADEISERLRLFYVALTRAREKIILVTELKEDVLSYKLDGVIDRETRSKCRNFASLLDFISKELSPFVKNINLDDLNMTKKYNFRKEIDYKKGLKEEDKIEVNEYVSNSNYVESSSFSKKENKLITEDEKKSIEFGLKFHEVFEYFDFNNPNYDNMNEFETKKIKAFLNTKILDGSINVYKEYEFIYLDNGEEKHGIIDLLIEYNDYFNIVDYKLKNVNDEAYLKQLNGYKKYIEKMTSKKVNIYLYSILDEKLVKE